MVVKILHAAPSTKASNGSGILDPSLVRQLTKETDYSGSKDEPNAEPR
jgi:hypothetical protein